jgi:hypothetical protein
MTPNHGGDDGYVRILASALPSVRLDHMASGIDMSIAFAEGADAAAPGGIVTGYTEGVGSWQGTGISVGWDWGMTRGLLVVLNPAEIRTNVRLVTADGHIEPPAIARTHFLGWIETLPWRDSAPIKQLVADDAVRKE